MIKIKQYTAREFRQILNRNGYKYIRCKGDHATYNNGKKSITFNTVRPKSVVIHRLIKDYGLKEE